MTALNRQVSSDIAKKRGAAPFDEKGYVLVTGLLALCLLSLFGIWALNTSDFELKTASNRQNLESCFNVAEGGAKQVGAAVGYARPSANPWFQVSNPNIFDQHLLPPTADYDPGGDITVSGTFPNDFDQANYLTWPRQNLLGDLTDDTQDYAYLVTYLYPDLPPKGYNAANFSGYKFRIATEQKTFIEIGGIKVGVKAST
jgi:hypothetical protein